MIQPFLDEARMEKIRRLAGQGAVVFLHVTWWRARLPGARKNTIQGRILLPDEQRSQLQALDTAVRKNLYLFSFHTRWGRFLPRSSHGAWRAQHDACARRFEQLRDWLVAHCEEWLDRPLNEFAGQRAVADWSRLHPDDTGRPPEAQIRRIQEEIRRRLPSKPDLFHRYRLRVDFFPLGHATVALPGSGERRIHDGEGKSAGVSPPSWPAEADDWERGQRDDFPWSDFLSDVSVDFGDRIEKACRGILRLRAAGDSIREPLFGHARRALERLLLLNFFGNKTVETLALRLIQQADKNCSQRDLSAFLCDMEALRTCGREQFASDRWAGVLGTEDPNVF